MSTARENPKAPHNQPFNINGKRSKSKVNSWWNAGASSYWRNVRRKGVEAEQDK